MGPGVMDAVVGGSVYFEREFEARGRLISAGFGLFFLGVCGMII